ncbi:MAG: hypothetical protein MUQ27_10940 [Acidimicrobiia bacterium]|nr:hypothetical protein [Acidimicrobiia bacterium]
MLAAGMEGTNKQHATGYTCHECGEVAVVDIDGGYLCAEHAIDAMIEVDLRAEELTVTVSVG